MPLPGRRLNAASDSLLAERIQSPPAITCGSWPPSKQEGPALLLSIRVPSG